MTLRWSAIGLVGTSGLLLGLGLVSTTLLLVVSVGLAMWAAAKVFRIGVLMTGKPPKPLEILRWIRAPIGAVPERKS